MGGWTANGKDGMTWDGSLNAKTFTGDGSHLTGISSSGVSSHALLTQLDYASAGHTGFASSAILSDYETIASAAAVYVPYTGATTDVDIGDNYFKNTIATGTAPYQCSSTTLNTNLNADLLDGNHSSAFLTSEADTLQTVTTRGASTNKALSSTYEGASAPFSVASTTLNSNFNADLLDSHHSSDFANTTLNNLGSVAINTDLVSDTDNTDSLGSATKGFKDLQLRNQAYLGGVTSTNTEYDLSSGLLGHWLMNDNAANKTVDDNRDTYDGTSIQNTSSITTAGKINTALSFNGTTDYITMGDVLDLDTGSTPLSICFWMKLGTSSDGTNLMPLTKQQSSGGYTGYAMWRQTDNKLNCSIGTTGNRLEHYTNRTFTVSDDWVHIVWTYDGSASVAGSIIYVNGSPVATTTATNTLGAAQDMKTTAPFNIGSRNNGNLPFKGNMDDVRFYNRALSSSEVTEIYNSGSGTEGEGTFEVGNPHQVIATSSSYTSAHSLDSLKDLAIEGELEVNGNSFYDGDLTIKGGENIILSATTGTKIGTATSQLLGFYNKTPVDQPATITDPSGGATIDAEARTAINALIDRLQELGLIA